MESTDRWTPSEISYLLQSNSPEGSIILKKVLPKVTSKQCYFTHLSFNHSTQVKGSVGAMLYQCRHDQNNHHEQEWSKAETPESLGVEVYYK